MSSKPGFQHIFNRLQVRYGRQQWWPGDSAFEVMVGAVLTQNTAWVNVERALANLRSATAMDPQCLVSVAPKTLATWLRPSGYFNVKTKRLRALCRWVLDSHGLPALSRETTALLRSGLLSVHGVGPETADAILLYAFQRPVFVVDAYTRRIFSRLNLCEQNEEYESLRLRFQSKLPQDVPLLNEYHALIVRHGKGTCKPRPLCHKCCLADMCPTGAAMI